MTVIWKPETDRQKRDLAARQKAEAKLTSLEKMKRRGGCDIGRVEKEINSLRKEYNLF